MLTCRPEVGPDLPGAYLFVRFDHSENISPRSHWIDERASTMLFYDAKDFGVEWYPDNKSKMVLWIPCSTDEPEKQQHYFYDWVKKPVKQSMFCETYKERALLIQGDYKGAFANMLWWGDKVFKMLRIGMEEVAPGLYQGNGKAVIRRKVVDAAKNQNL